MPCRERPCDTHGAELTVTGCAECSAVANSVGTVTCSSLENSQVDACEPGFILDESGPADACRASCAAEFDAYTLSWATQDDDVEEPTPETHSDEFVSLYRCSQIPVDSRTDMSSVVDGLAADCPDEVAALCPQGVGLAICDSELDEYALAVVDGDESPRTPERLAAVPEIPWGALGGLSGRGTPGNARVLM